MNGRLFIAAMAATSIATLAGCGSGRGVLIGAQDNTRFATDNSMRLVMMMNDDRGAEVRTLQGDYVRTILRGKSLILDLDDRVARMVARDSDSAFVVVAGGPLYRLRLPLESTWSLALDPAGTRIAATTGKGGQLQILSFDTREILRTTTCPADASCFWAAWDRDDANVVWFITGTAPDGYIRFNFETGETRRVSREDSATIRIPAQNSLVQSTCRATGARLVQNPDNTIDLVEKGQAPRKLVVVKGVHYALLGERFPPLQVQGFLEGCHYAVFTYVGESYLLDLATGAKGKLPGYPVYSGHF